MELEFTKQLISFGFVQSQSDHCLFVKGSGKDFLCLHVYVDDLLVLGQTKSLIVELKGFLDSTFTIQDLGQVKYFYGNGGCMHLF